MPNEQGVYHHLLPFTIYILCHFNRVFFCAVWKDGGPQWGILCSMLFILALQEPGIMKTKGYILQTLQELFFSLYQFCFINF